MTERERNKQQNAPKWTALPLVIGALVLCLISGIVGAALAGKFNVTWGSRFDVSFEQSISIILSALGAILTALALLFAILAIVGWATFSQQVDANVRRYIEDDFKHKGALFNEVTNDLAPKLKQVLKPELEKSMFAGTQPVSDDVFGSADDAEQEQ